MTIEFTEEELNLMKKIDAKMAFYRSVAEVNTSTLVSIANDNRKTIRRRY